MGKLLVFIFLLLLNTPTLAQEKNLELNQIKRILDYGLFSDENVLGAKNSLEKLKKTQPNNPFVWTESARFEIKCGLFTKHCKKEGAFQRALRNVLVAQKVAPNEAEGWSLAGHIYDNLRLYDKAYEVLDRAITLDPNHGWANVNYASLIIDRVYLEGYHKDDDFQAKTEEKFSRTLKAVEHLKVVLDGAYSKRLKRVAHSKCLKLNFVNPDIKLYCNQASINNFLYRNDQEKAWAYGNMAAVYLTSKKEYENARKYAELALEIKSYPMVRQVLSGALLGLWMESDYKDSKLLDEAIKVYPRVLDIVNMMYLQLYRTDFLKKLYQAKGINYSLPDYKGNTLLLQALRLYLGNGDSQYIKSLLKDFQVYPDMPIKFEGSEEVTTLPIHIEKQIKKSDGEIKERYKEALKIIKKYSS